MKYYNRKTKCWEDEKPVGDLKRPETCKGKKPHDFVLLIPQHISRDHHLCKEEIEQYYAIEEIHKKTELMYEAALLKIGLHSMRCNFKVRKFYKCAKCGKEKYE